MTVDELETQNAELRKALAAAVAVAEDRRLRLLEMERENTRLKGGLAICGPAALWPES